MKIISSGDKAILSLKKGVDAVADIVKQTLGPNGSNVILTRSLLPPYITNDGVSIAKEIELEDEIENVGAQIIKDVTEKTNDIVGDGTTTAIVLAQAIFNEVYNKYLDPNNLTRHKFSPMKVRKELKDACVEIIDELKKEAKEISSLKDLEKVAFVSMEDKEISKKIASMVNALGKDGTITVEEGDGFDLETEIINGLEFNQGILSPYMETNERHEAVIENARILVTNKRLETAQSVLPVIQDLIKEGINKLVIIGDFDQSVIQNFLVNKINGFHVTAVRSPMTETLKDICALTGAYFYDRDLTEDFTYGNLGTAEKIISTQAKTLVVGGKGSVEKRVADLKEQIKKTTSSFDKKNLEERIGKLTLGVGVIKVGAISDADRKYLKLKIDDTVSATKAALQEGVIPGGGLALKNVSERINNILSKAILIPFTLIKESGIESISGNVVDPLKVTRTALESAVSVISLLITSCAVIANKNEDKDES